MNLICHSIGWTRSGSGKGDVLKYHLNKYSNTITSFAGQGICKDKLTGMYNTTPYILIEYDSLEYANNGFSASPRK